MPLIPAKLLTGVAPSAQGVTNGDSHNHTGGAGATIPVAGGGTGATTAGAALTALGGATDGWNTVLEKTFGNSQSQGDLEAEGFVFVPGAGSIADGASHLTITVPAGSQQEWTNITFNAPRLKYPLDFDVGSVIRVYASVRHDAVNDQGGAIIMDWDGAGSYWYQTRKYRSGGNLAIDVKYNPNNNDYAAAVGSQDEGWIGMQFTGSYAQGIWSDNTWAAGDPASWTRPADFRARKARDDAFFLTLAGLSFGGNPGSTIDFGKLVIQKKV